MKQKRLALTKNQQQAAIALVKGGVIILASCFQNSPPSCVSSSVSLRETDLLMYWELSASEGRETRFAAPDSMSR